VHNTYNETVINNVTVNKVSYNGGAGGVAAAPTAQERTAAQEPHVAPTPMQHQHVQEAARNPALAAKTNGGHPAIAATPRPAAFSAPGVVGARGAVAPPPRSAGAPTPGTPNAGTQRFNNGNGAAPVGAQPNMARTNTAGVQPNVAHAQPPGGQPNAGHAPPPGAQPNASHAPPAGSMRPQAAGTRQPGAAPQPPKPQQHPKSPENKKHEPENKTR
jgi:hypothetical protein